MDYSQLLTNSELDEYKLQNQYSKLDNEREAINSRNEQYAGWTLPSLFPTTEEDETAEVQYDYQSLGAQLVNSLANKIVKTLFHPARPFFKIDLSDKQRKELVTVKGGEAQLDKELASVERKGLKAFNKTNSLTEYVKAAKLAVVTGEALIQSDANNNKVIHSQRNYVVERDRVGGLIRCIIREKKRLSSLPKRIQRVARRELTNATPDTLVDLYTGILRVGVDYYVWQEVDDFAIGHYKAGKYTRDTLPFKFMIWDWMKGRTYGIGLVEHNAGDFNALSRLANAIDDYTIIATDLKILVNPTGSTDIAGINKAASGAAVAGLEEDIHILKYEVAQVAEFLQWRYEKLERTLGAQFLMTSATTRDAERVTAEEIRRNAMELENMHGGIYSRWALQVQHPEARAILQNLESSLSKIDVTILTGLDSLSRATELDNMRAFLTDMAQMAEIPQAVLIRMKIEDIMAIIGAGHGVDYDKFMRSEKEVEVEQKKIMEMNAANAGNEAGAIAQAQAPAQQQR